MSSGTSQKDLTLLHKLLTETSTDKYYIDYCGSLSNHISQGIIALHRLGASETTIRAFISTYAQKLEAPDPYKAQPALMPDKSLSQMVGKRQGYYELREYYRNTVGQDIGTALASHFPSLCRGMVGSALHGLIYTGYMVAAQHPPGVVEGLAYMTYCSMPLETERDLADPRLGRGEMDVVDVVAQVQSSSLGPFMLRKVEEAPWATFSTGFQRKVAVLFTCKADRILDFVYQIRFPDHVLAAGSAQALGRWLVDTALTLYVAAQKRNDFFLLHGVTAAWSLYQILPLLPSQADVTRAATVYLSMLLAAYIAQGAPNIDPALLSEASSVTWPALLQKTLGDPLPEDEHIVKLVQVCRDMAQEEEGDDGALYRIAAQVALNNNLQF